MIMISPRYASIAVYRVPVFKAARPKCTTSPPLRTRESGLPGSHRGRSTAEARTWPGCGPFRTEAPEASSFLQQFGELDGGLARAPVTRRFRLMPRWSDAVKQSGVPPRAGARGSVTYAISITSSLSRERQRAVPGLFHTISRAGCDRTPSLLPARPRLRGIPLWLRERGP